jgi:hypothetical protein
VKGSNSFPELGRGGNERGCLGGPLGGSRWSPRLVSAALTFRGVKTNIRPLENDLEKLLKSNSFSDALFRTHFFGR